MYCQFIFNKPDKSNFYNIRKKIRKDIIDSFDGIIMNLLHLYIKIKMSFLSGHICMIYHTHTHAQRKKKEDLIMNSSQFYKNSISGSNY